MKRRTVGTNPLDAVIPAKSSGAKAQENKEGKEAMTFHIGAAMIAKLRDIAFWDRITLVELVNAALSREIKRRETARGKAYPARTGKLRTGRPVL